MEILNSDLFIPFVFANVVSLVTAYFILRNDGSWFSNKPSVYLRFLEYYFTYLGAMVVLGGLIYVFFSGIKSIFNIG